MRYPTCFFILLLVVGCTKPIDIIQSTVIIDNAGSGTIIKVQPVNDYFDKITILTVAHVLLDNNPIVIIKNSRLATTSILMRDAEEDIALITTVVPKGECKAIPLGMSLPQPGDTIWYCGYPSMVPVFVHGTVNQLHETHISFIAPLEKGTSGGGIYNDRLELIGIVHGYVPTGKTIFVGLFVPVTQGTISWYEKNKILNKPVRWVSVPVFVPKPVSEWD